MKFDYQKIIEYVVNILQPIVVTYISKKLTAIMWTIPILDWAMMALEILENAGLTRDGNDYVSAIMNKILNTHVKPVFSL